MRANQAPATFGIIIAIGVVFLAELMSGIPIANVTEADTPRLVALGAIVPDTIARGELWRFLTAMFLHIGALHLLLNLWALYQLGGVFELMFGSKRFLVTYFASGLVASATSAIITKGFSAGASGAIFGILGALIISIRRSPRWRHQNWTRGLTNQLIGWAAINIFIGFSFPGIDNAAHIGGFISGLLLGFIPHREPPPPPSRITIEPGHDGEHRISYDREDPGRR